MSPDATSAPTPGAPRARYPDEPAISAPAEPAPIVTARSWRECWQPILGLMILCACFEAGEWIKQACHLILPGNILGLFLLLALLSIGAVPLRWVESAARGLLWLLPLLFMPLFIFALRDHEFWRIQGSRLGGAVALATFVLWAAAGHSAQWLLARSDRRSSAPVRGDVAGQDP